MGFTGKKISDADKIEMKRLRDCGVSEFQIALRFGVYPNTVRHHLGLNKTKARNGLLPEPVGK